MKIAYLAARNVIHTVRWVNALAQRGHRIFLITMHAQDGDPLDERVQVFRLPVAAPWGYFFNTLALVKLLRQLQPDILHVHYATGYGTLGRLCQFKPLILSVWGSDIFDFPRQSWLHRYLLRKNLQAANQICSTSQVMAMATQALCGNEKPITLTPFGIDTNFFSPRPSLRDQRFLTIGTVKTLAPKYGIDTLIRAFSQLRQHLLTQHPSLAQSLRLCIAGDGPQRFELQQLVKQLGLDTITELAGHIPHAQVPDYLNKLDIYVAASRLESESFGVAILEASACGLPVVVSRIGGLPEVVKEGVTGWLVEVDQVEQWVTALLKLIENKNLAQQMGMAGRQYVMEQYEWENCVNILEGIYANTKS